MIDARPAYAVLLDGAGEETGTKIRIAETAIEQNCNEISVTIKGTINRFMIDSRSTKLTGKSEKTLTPKKVIFNPPATIVLWKDGSKTAVKCDSRDEYVPLFGLVLCYLKKSLGNTSRELNRTLRDAEREIEKWQRQEEEK